MECPSIVSQKVCVEAKVTIAPDVKMGDVHACCVGEPQFEECRKNPCGCTYMVSQMMCVRFPLTLSATAKAKPVGIVCREPKVEPCVYDKPCIEDMPSVAAESFICEPHETPKQPDKLPAIRRCGFCFPPLCFMLFGCACACANGRRRRCMRF